MFKVIVPTLNAAPDWMNFSLALRNSIAPGNVVILDSSSSDNTAQLAAADGFHVHNVPRDEFNHGGTRQLGVELAFDAEIVVFLTQDAVLETPNAISQLLRAFEDPTVAAAYGRQLPSACARGIEAHARLFNYPSTSQVRDLSDRKTMGFKAAFLSNSFSAYRRSCIRAMGGFPSRVVFGEDTLMTAKLLLGGYHIAYVADACVYHSHCYLMRQEFRRYFDIGVLHRRERHLLQQFGSANGEGLRFVRSELRYLCRHDPALLPSALMRTALKYLGYRLGRVEHRLAPGLKRRISLDSRFWAEQV